MKWMELETYLERLAPSGLACSWDNSGLLAGRTDKEIKKIGVALDATMDAVLFGIKEGCDLLLTHHPLLFSPVKRICDDTVLGKKLLLLLRNDISLYAMHTTFDSARGGMADMAAEALGLVEVRRHENDALPWSIWGMATPRIFWS